MGSQFLLGRPSVPMIGCFREEEAVVNDPVPIFNFNTIYGFYYWTFKRLLAANLMPLSITLFAAGSLNPTTNTILYSTILLHSHISFQSVIIDYIPKTHYSSLRKIFWWGLNVATVTVGVGLYEFKTNDINVTEAIKKI
ncbi:hypothetical protein TrVFT333_006069 [Trichoderma virens FT-333]|nr:hypothetical protein TrVFT333_006069 [Trichoderma virens FT-333]